MLWITFKFHMRPSFEKNQLEIIKLKRNRIIFKRATLRRLRQILLGVLQSSLRKLDFFADRRQIVDWWSKHGKIGRQTRKQKALMSNHPPPTHRLQYQQEIKVLAPSKQTDLRLMYANYIASVKLINKMNTPSLSGNVRKLVWNATSDIPA